MAHKDHTIMRAYFEKKKSKQTNQTPPPPTKPLRLSNYKKSPIVLYYLHLPRTRN